VNALADELQHLVLHEARCEDRTDQGDGNVMGAYAGSGRAVEFYCDDLGLSDVVGSAKELFYQLPVFFIAFYQL
jgi:hypothetical protein